MAKKKSRAERFSEAQTAIETGGLDFDILRDELQSWLDNMPENLQSGSKAEEIQDAIDQLDEASNSVEEIVYMVIEFPKAFG